MKILSAALLLVLSGGCASFNPDGGFGSVESMVRERTGQQTTWVRSEDDANTVRARVKELLAQPLTADGAAQVALLNNAGLQASFASIGLAEAEFVQASRWRGPRFSFARLRRGDETEIERGIFFDVLGLFAIPLSAKVEQGRFVQAQARAAGEALRIALEARKAWYAAVAAEESVRYAEQVRVAAEASAELARRMAAVGNWSKLSQQREQAFYAEAAAQFARARQASVAARERLTRLMGLWGENTRYALPERLPELPKGARELADLEAQALAQRFDVQAARREVQELGESLGLAKGTRFLDSLELGLLSNSESGKPRQRGWEVELGLPIFGLGSAKVARSEHLYRQALHRAVETAVEARSEIRETYHGYRTAFDLARHYRDEIVPLRKRISEEILLRYNGMLMSVFELLADARDSVMSVNAYIEALRDFWLAETDLQGAMTGNMPRSATGGRSMPARMPTAKSGGEH